MKLSLAFGLSVLTSTGGCNSLAVRDTCPAQNATVSTLVYAYPLLSFAQAWDGDVVARNTTTNTLLATTRLATPQDTQVVKPNFDTLYSHVYYDVSSDDLEITVPTINDRYWDLAFYTPYGDNYLNIGAVGSDKPGKYLLTSERPGVQANTSTNSANSQYEKSIVAETTMGILLIRILLKNQSTDLDIVRKYQADFAVTSIPRNEISTGPTLNTSIFANVSKSPVENLLALTARILPSLTDETTLPESLNSSLADAGISNGTYTASSCVNASAALSAAKSTIVDFVRQPYSIFSLGNNWFAVNNTKVGQYGTDYAARAYLAVNGYLALVHTQAIYPNNLQNLTLQPNESYIFAFSGKPPVESVGFWSLTVYNEAGFLIENSINRYALGDRNNLTYANGTSVYSTDGDGPFEVLVQSEQPPANWTSNWLPAPATGQRFVVILRWYVPQPALTNGSYVYPTITKGKVITGNSSNSTTSTSGSPSATSNGGSPSTSNGGSSSTTTSAAVASSTGGAVPRFTVESGKLLLAGIIPVLSTILFF